MEKSVLAQGGCGRRQALRVLIAAITIITWGALDQVGATAMKRVLTPTELLDHRQFGGDVINAIAHRADAPLNDDTVHFSRRRDTPDQHALRANLASPERGKPDQLTMLGNDTARTVTKGDALNLHQQVTTGGTAHILNGYGHRQWAPRFYELMPFVDQRDRYDDASGSHPFIKILSEDAQVFGGDIVRSSGDDIGVSRAFVRLGGGLQTLGSDVVRHPSRIDANLGKPDTINGSLQPLASLLKAYQKADRPDQGEQYLRPGEKCYLPGPLGCSPLSAKIGATLICGLIAWSLIFRIFDLLDRRRRNWLLIIPLGLTATVLYLLPSYLVVGFPWNW